jgi:hypothetical protein
VDHVPGNVECCRLVTRENEQGITSLDGKWSDQGLNDLSSDDGEPILENVITVGGDEVIQAVQVVGVDVVEGRVSVGSARRYHEHDMDAVEPCAMCICPWQAWWTGCRQSRRRSCRSVKKHRKDEDFMSSMESSKTRAMEKLATVQVAMVKNGRRRTETFLSMKKMLSLGL